MIESLGKLLKNLCSGHTQDTLYQHLWGWDPGISVLYCSRDNSKVQPRLKTLSPTRRSNVSNGTPGQHPGTHTGTMLPVYLKGILCNMKERDLPKHEAALLDGQGTGQCVTSPLRGVEQSCLGAADWQTQTAQQAS